MIRVWYLGNIWLLNIIGVGLDCALGILVHTAMVSWSPGIPPEASTPTSGGAQGETAKPPYLGTPYGPSVCSMQ